MTVDAAIKSLKEARRALIDAKNGIVERAVFPWREDDVVTPTVDYDDLIYDIECNIVNIERNAYRDPEQDMEIRMELEASMRMNGVRDDPHLYMHTPFEEELFQERIREQVNYGYYDSEGGWNEGLYDYGPNSHKCVTCGGAVWDEEVMFVAGHETCESCNDEALAFFFLLALITNTATHTDKWEIEWNYDMEDE